MSSAGRAASRFLWVSRTILTLFFLFEANWLSVRQKTTIAPKMEGAFTHLGNHLISDSAAAINAGDDLSTIDADESILDREYGRGNLSGGPRRRRRDDDDDGPEGFDDNDTESMVSMPVDAANGKPPVKAEEEKELPPHACA